MWFQNMLGDKMWLYLIYDLSFLKVQISSPMMCSVKMCSGTQHVSYNVELCVNIEKSCFVPSRW